MAKVNLLPPELGGIKKTVSPAFNTRKLLIFLLSLGLIFFLLGIYLRIETMYREKSFNRLIQQYTQAQELTKKINALKQEQAKLDEEVNILNSYLKRNVLWSEKLRQLRNLISKEVWLTRLSFEKKAVKDSYLNNLYLKGSLIPQDKNSPIGTLSIFVNKLKEDKAFFGDFDNLILSDFRTETYKNAEVMTFFIEMSLKQR